ncbi:MAG: hypothetical protein F6J93_37880 [Oscillatoria sp. SIO1A7]|nr:hypothetical protein [Oscillatoria sp. SIO1A7]
MPLYSGSRPDRPGGLFLPRCTSFRRFRLHPRPHTLHPTPYTLDPTPYTLDPTP